MATFVASPPVNMETDIVPRRDVLAALTRGRTNSATAFAATASGQAVEIDAFGPRFNPVGGEPNTGIINRLTVVCGDLIRNLAHTFTGLLTGLAVVVPNATSTASYEARHALLHDDDTVFGLGPDDGNRALLHGAPGADGTHGGIGNDTRDGNEGDDHGLFGRDGNDHLDGGAHDDESLCVWWGG